MALLTRARAASPTTLLVLGVLSQPLLQRSEVFEQRRRVAACLAAQHGERLGPRAARAHREHLDQALARLTVAIDAAFVERSLVPRRAAERAMELELVDPREKVTDVRRAPGDMVLRPGIER